MLAATLFYLRRRRRRRRGRRGPRRRTRAMDARAGGRSREQRQRAVRDQQPAALLRARGDPVPPGARSAWACSTGSCSCACCPCCWRPSPRSPRSSSSASCCPARRGPGPRAGSPSRSSRCSASSPPACRPTRCSTRRARCCLLALARAFRRGLDAGDAAPRSAAPWRSGCWRSSPSSGSSPARRSACCCSPAPAARDGAGAGGAARARGRGRRRPAVAAYAVACVAVWDRPPRSAAGAGPGGHRPGRGARRARPGGVRERLVLPLAALPAAAAVHGRPVPGREPDAEPVAERLDRPLRLARHRRGPSAVYRWARWVLVLLAPAAFATELVRAWRAGRLRGRAGAELLSYAAVARRPARADRLGRATGARETATRLPAGALPAAAAAALRARRSRSRRGRSGASAWRPWWPGLVVAAFGHDLLAQLLTVSRFYG